ncbi:hypothetical protein [Lactococcus phage PMBT68]|nr:hypothetical protein [Lactococcus phage P1411]
MTKKPHFEHYGLFSFSFHFHVLMLQLCYLILSSI